MTLINNHYKASVCVTADLSIFLALQVAARAGQGHDLPYLVRYWLGRVQAATTTYQMVPLRTSYCWWSTGPFLLLPLSHMSSSIPYHFAQWRSLESHLTEIPCLVICISYGCFPLIFFCFVFVYGYEQIWLWFLRCIWLLSIDDKWWTTMVFFQLNYRKLKCA